MTEDQRYPGLELDLFAMARNWKAYVRHEIGGYIKGHILEVGAGIGQTAKALINGHEESWICLEPDRRLAERIAVTLNTNSMDQSKRPETIVGKPFYKPFDGGRAHGLGPVEGAAPRT